MHLGETCGVVKLMMLGNCQSGGLADSLELLIPGSEIGHAKCDI